MRFSVCVRLAQTVGFFWGTALVPYGVPFWGSRARGGYGKQWRWMVWALSEGGLGHRGGGRGGVKNMAQVLFFFAPPHLPIRYPWGWNLLRLLKIYSYRGIRYRLGLPSRGQRTHTNRQTVRRHGDLGLGGLRRGLWRGRLWISRKKRGVAGGPRKAVKARSKRLVRKGPVVRSKTKKRDVWR